MSDAEILQPACAGGSCTPLRKYHALLCQTVVVQKNANLLDWKENYAE
jgi:hypothetical protein